MEERNWALLKASLILLKLYNYNWIDLDINHCYDDNTYNLNETILDAFHDLIKWNDLLGNTSNWIVNKGNVYKGQCHTFQYQNTLQANGITDGLAFAINPNLSYRYGNWKLSKYIHPYRVVFHDPKFFLPSENPMVIPRLKIQFQVWKKDFENWKSQSSI